MHSYFDVARPVVIGHRGSAGTHPENTLASFEAALAAGAEILESDVHISRDGVPILLHDPSVDRTTEGRGRAADLDWADLARLDAGYRFDVDGTGFPFRNRGIRIARLEDAFQTFSRARFNLEIKSADPRASRACLDLIDRYRREDRTLLTAGEDDAMGVLRKALAAHRCRPALGACLGDLLAVLRSLEEGTAIPEHVMAIQIPAEFGGQPVATPALIDHAHASGLEVHVWTVNAIAEIEALVALGVDGIVTDEPGRMAAWKRARRESR